jgi:hypothetical protein
MYPRHCPDAKRPGNNMLTVSGERQKGLNP